MPAVLVEFCGSPEGKWPRDAIGIVVEGAHDSVSAVAEAEQELNRRGEVFPGVPVQDLGVTVESSTGKRSIRLPNI